MLAPPSIWWKKLGRYEKNWVTIAFIWCMVLSAMMIVWFKYGNQNVPIETYRTTPDDYRAMVDAFVAENQVGEEQGIPVVEASPDSDAYIYGRQWQWYPILKLKKGEEYRIHLSSLDVLHGFSLQPVNLNFMAVPGYDYVLRLTPTTAGEFSVVCNEYCLVLHHTMVGKIIVDE